MSKIIPAADVDNLKSWHKYKKGICNSCRGTCCSLPVEVRFDDLVRLGLADEFERSEPAKKLARRLEKEGVLSNFNHKNEIFTLARYSNDDCIYLDQKSRLCQVYTQRPDTCRNHPQIGPRPGFCPYQPK